MATQLRISAKDLGENIRGQILILRVLVAVRRRSQESSWTTSLPSSATLRAHYRYTSRL